MKKRLIPVAAAIALAVCLISGSAYAAGEITVQKLISIDGGVTWADANEEPGPIVAEGSQVNYQYVIQNNTDVALEYIVTDSDFIDPIGQGTLDPYGTATLYATGTAVLEQHSNVVVVIATTADETTYSGEDIANYYGIIQSQPIAIDIKPGSDPNSINLKSKGVVPLALISTADFDATSVFEGEPVVIFEGATALRWAIEDVNGDGIDDVILHFETQDLDLDGNSTQGELTIGYSYDPVGNLISSYEGQDTVNIVPKGKSESTGAVNSSNSSQNNKGNRGNRGKNKN